MQTVEKNVDKGGEPAEMVLEDNEQKQEGEGETSAKKEEERCQQVLNEIAEETNRGEMRLIM
jgi:hypothetical protein